MSTDDIPDQAHNWEAYSDYAHVAEQKYDAITEAIKQFRLLQSKHRYNGDIVRRSTARKAHAHIFYATDVMIDEIEQNKDNEPYDEIYEAWSGEDGYVTRLGDVNLTRGVPRWLNEFMDQLRLAGWRLGYLRAGRRVVADPEDDDVQIAEMLER